MMYQVTKMWFMTWTGKELSLCIPGKRVFMENLCPMKKTYSIMTFLIQRTCWTFVLLHRWKMYMKSLSQRRPHFRCELLSTLYEDFMTHDSLKTHPFHLLYLNPHHYPQPGSSEVVVNYDLQSVIIIKLRSADANLETAAVSTQDQTRRKGFFTFSCPCTFLSLPT